MSGCTQPAWARGWCNMHYLRWQRYGDPLGATPIPTLEERFWSKVARSGPEACWEWTASKSPKGYGKFMLDGVPQVASRVAYAMTNGPIPAELCVLHTCDNPGCCNPAHLWLGTIADNNADMVAKGRHKLNIIRVTHCYRGHPYDDANTYVLRGRRSCRACRLVNERLRRARQRS